MDDDEVGEKNDAERGDKRVSTILAAGGKGDERTGSTVVLQISNEEVD